MISPVVAGQVFLKPKRAQPFYGRHPWVFAGAIDRVEGDPADGAVVDVRSHVGSFVARGLFNSQSKIRVRLYSWDESADLDDAFFRSRLQRAIDLRHNVLKLNTSPDAAYRVCFSEADFLSGLVVDRYGDWAAVQFNALGLSERQEMIGKIIQDVLGVRGVYRKVEKGVGKLEGVKDVDGLLCGELPPPEIVVSENGIKFAINLVEGQKTGFFLDQRDNRATVAKFCGGKRVLDAFSYSGGFGLYAAKAGAAEVVCVDSSEGAVMLAMRNADLNRLPSMAFTKNDVFQELDSLVAAGRKFDVVVLDPPKFARDQHSLPQALRGYRRLVQQGLKLLDRDGVLVKCCCTGLVTMEMLEEVIAQTAVAEKRDFQFLDRRGPSADHPVSATCREGAYLKCIIGRVG
ncbi:MAG: class I SAM-dependent rRNA methyltransferase [Fimbriiglobus sp.]|nr:class I SAM-dependent rRNA methyltransferase [Fimbriiglobus sp.]